MNKSAIIRTTRRSVVAGAIVALCTIGGQGVAEAYPPSPPTGELPDTPVDDTPTSALPAAPSGTLPQTGGPGTTHILALAGAALAGGLAVSGVAGRSRRGSDAVT